MTLVEIKLPLSVRQLPDSVVEFLAEADERIEQFQRAHPSLGGFVPSDFVTIYRALAAIVDANLAPGQAFCEWGSGLGVVTSLAAMLDFDACGIEIEAPLVDAAQELAADFDLAVMFAHGSFIPAPDAGWVEEVCRRDMDGFYWLVTDSRDAYEELERNPEDFDLVFAYPWPSEQNVVEKIFDLRASNGALLLVYDQCDTVRLLRKVPTRRA